MARGMMNCKRAKKMEMRVKGLPAALRSFSSTTATLCYTLLSSQSRTINPSTKTKEDRMFESMSQDMRHSQIEAAVSC